MSKGNVLPLDIGWEAIIRLYLFKSHNPVYLKKGTKSFAVGILSHHKRESLYRGQNVRVAIKWGQGRDASGEFAPDLYHVPDFHCVSSKCGDRLLEGGSA